MCMNFDLLWERVSCTPYLLGVGTLCGEVPQRAGRVQFWAAEPGQHVQFGLWMLLPASALMHAWFYPCYLWQHVRPSSVLIACIVRHFFCLHVVVVVVLWFFFPPLLMLTSLHRNCISLHVITTWGGVFGVIRQKEAENNSAYMGDVCLLCRTYSWEGGG